MAKAKVKGLSEVVNVFIYAVENRADAAEWLKPVRSGQVPAGWTTDHVHVGDEGFLAKYKNGERFDIQFRKGRVVVKIGANDLIHRDRICEIHRRPESPSIHGTASLRPF